jgi:HAD superfamily hydrolase (TIGR01509 family)
VPNPLDLVIFDNDGVLVDSEGLANQVLADLLTSYGYPVTRDESVRRFMGTTMAGVRATVEDEIGAPLPADFEQRYHDGLFAGFRSDLQPVPGVVAVLDDLERRGVPFCVASSGTHERIGLALSIVGLLDRFGDRIFSADDVARGKPAPDLFLHAAARMSTPPERCVVVEDSPAGVTAARAAGMRVVGYAAMTPAARLADTGAGAGAGADVVITSMADLPAALGLAGTYAPGGRQTGV